MTRFGLQGGRARNKAFRTLPQLTAAAGIAATLLVLLGCSSGEKSEPASRASGIANHPPVVKAASIMPSPLTLSGPLTVRVEAQDLDLNTISFRYR